MAHENGHGLVLFLEMAKMERFLLESLILGPTVVLWLLVAVVAMSIVCFSSVFANDGRVPKDGVFLSRSYSVSYLGGFLWFAWSLHFCSGGDVLEWFSSGNG